MSGRSYRRPLSLAILLLSLFAFPGRVCLQEREPAAPKHECAASKFKVVLDVGHSVEVSGALSARGVPEYEFNLKLAARISEELIKAGFEKTFVMATPGSGYRSLLRRTARAKELGADLFLSIHHDSVQDRYLEAWRVGGERQYFSDRYSGYSLFVSRDNPAYEASLSFASELGGELQARGLKFSPHHAEKIRGEGRELIDNERGVYRFDQLVVLRTAAMPAALLEAGIIVNRNDEVELAKPERQQVIAEATAAAVRKFCEARKPL